MFRVKGSWWTNWFASFPPLSLHNSIASSIRFSLLSFFFFFKSKLLLTIRHSYNCIIFSLFKMHFLFDCCWHFESSHLTMILHKFTVAAVYGNSHPEYAKYLVRFCNFYAYRTRSYNWDWNYLYNSTWWPRYRWCCSTQSPFFAWR